MNRFARFALLPMLALTLALCAAGCHKDGAALTAASNQSDAQDQGSDPAAANLAPSNANAPAPAAYSPAGANQQQAAPSESAASYDAGPDQDSGDPGYGIQPVSYASQAPPPLPVYDQPEAPGDGYLWTPGYWGYTGDGYYWVPGVWVQAPYEGALWTPGYWGYSHHRYGFYRGYWGPHIGFYGGVDYGFGYIGFGYGGGYWGGGHFNYNRSVNNVNISVVHNVYNRTIVQNNSASARVSFNGGQGGLQVRARPAELAARRETHSEPMSAQAQNEHLASTNRAQFVHADGGRPASLAVSRPLAADRNVRVPAAVQQRNSMPEQQRGAAEARPGSVQPQGRSTAPAQNQPNQNQRNQSPVNRDATNRTAPVQQAPRQVPPQRQATPARPMPEHRQAVPVQQPPQRAIAPPQQRTAPQQQRQQSAAPRPAAPPQQRSAPQQQRQQSPAPRAAAPAQERPASRPAEAGRQPQEHEPKH